MVTGELKSKIDNLWEIFWTGGLTNPLDVVEQMTYLMFIRDLDDADNVHAKEAAMLGLPHKSIFAGEIQIGDRKIDGSQLKWSTFHDFPAAKMYSTMQEWVFPFIKNLHGDKESAYSKYMGDAIFKVPTPLMLDKIVTTMDAIYEQMEQIKSADTRGDVYEYLLLGLQHRLGAVQLLLLCIQQNLLGDHLLLRLAELALLHLQLGLGLVQLVLTAGDLRLVDLRQVEVLIDDVEHHQNDDQHQRAHQIRKAQPEAAVVAPVLPDARSSVGSHALHRPFSGARVSAGSAGRHRGAQRSRSAPAGPASGCRRGDPPDPGTGWRYRSPPGACGSGNPRCFRPGSPRAG